MRNLKAFIADLRGATAVEYGLLAAVISVAIVAGMTSVGTSLQNVLTTVGNNLH